MIAAKGRITIHEIAEKLNSSKTTNPLFLIQKKKKTFYFIVNYRKFRDNLIRMLY